MKHLGDITKLNGAELPVVDVITGGSPCQNLSVAGNREGLDGNESKLFLEQIRIVKEMREHDRSTGRAAEYIRPRWMVWENVPGALSSSGKGMPKGSDFQRVLTEIVRIAEPNAPDVPMPNRGGWSKSGCLYDELGRWSVAWRVHDAQFWGATLYDDEGNVIQQGTPQRRKRIALVADFAGLCASEVLFERKGLQRHSSESSEAWEGTAGDFEESTGESSEQNEE